MKELPDIRIKPQQNEQERQEWIKNNPNKYTRLPDPGENHIVRDVTDYMYAKNTFKYGVNQYGLALGNTNRKGFDHKVLLYDTLKAIQPAELEELEKLTGISKDTIGKHLNNMPNMTKTRMGNKTYFYIKEEETKI